MLLYLGIAADLKEALSFYSDAGGKGDPTLAQEQAAALMQQEKLREIAVVLTQRVRANATIDWTIKENVKAKLRVIVRRMLREFGYPPDMQLLATETVIEQAKMIADELAASS
jgi:type I restriction enzyme R subunit